VPEINPEMNGEDDVTLGDKRFVSGDDFRRSGTASASTRVEDTIIEFLRKHFEGPGVFGSKNEDSAALQGK
jgi:hypothetical protein